MTINLNRMPWWLHTSFMSKEVFVIRIPPSLDRRIDRAADLHFDGRSEVIRRAAHIGLTSIRDKNLECDDHHTFEDRNVRLAVRIDPTLRRRLDILAEQRWTTRAGVLRAALHYGLWKLGAPLGREHYVLGADRNSVSS